MTTGQGNLIAVDPETFELVRQIQALRDESAEGGEQRVASAATTGVGEVGSGAASGAGSSSVEALSDEKLINLFLLIARGTNRVDGGRRPASDAPFAPRTVAGDHVGSGDATGATMSTDLGKAGVLGKRDGEEIDGHSPEGGVNGGKGIVGAVEAMFTVPIVPNRRPAEAPAGSVSPADGRLVFLHCAFRVSRRELCLFRLAF